MKEHQHIEWKESWRDEYLKWISGFANAEGGVLVIGRNDRGQAVGVKDARKLLVDIPNRVRDVLGVMVDVNLITEKGKELVEIKVEPYPSPISYEGIQRRETFLYPDEALREALLNAIVHKDYSSGVPIQISVYDDKIVLWNPGQLPHGWTLKRLLGKHPSNPPNPLLANAFFRAGYIEAWGRGIEKIGRECREHDIEPPIYDFEMSGLMLMFHANPKHLPGTRVEARVETLPETLPETPQRILSAFAAHPDWTLPQVARSIGKSKSAVQRAVNKLRTAGRLRHVGPRKGGHWEALS